MGSVPLWMASGLSKRGNSCTFSAGHYVRGEMRAVGA